MILLYSILLQVHFLKQKIVLILLEHVEIVVFILFEMKIVVFILFELKIVLILFEQVRLGSCLFGNQSTYVHLLRL